MTDLRLRASDFAARYCRWDAINEVTDVLTALLQAVDAEATERADTPSREFAVVDKAAKLVCRINTIGCNGSWPEDDALAFYDKHYPEDAPHAIKRGLFIAEGGE